MRQISAPGNSWHQNASLAPTRVMKVFTVTIVDEVHRGDHHLLSTAQHRTTATYNRFAHTVASFPPPVIDIRL